MNDPELDKLHTMVAARNYSGIPTDAEYLLREKMVKRYLPFVEKMAQANFLRHNLFRVDDDGNMLEAAELEICGAHEETICDDPHISLNGFSVTDGMWLSNDPAPPRGKMLHEVIDSAL